MNPYDELPYRSFPVEWTAPERLCVASLLNGGPRTRLRDYRVLELGCASGGNLIPLAYYRPDATFVGVDGSQRQIEVAEGRRESLRLDNLRFHHADIGQLPHYLHEQFDYVLAHGVFSWIPDDVRDALLSALKGLVRPGGLLYLNYNARPGWNVRGLVRGFVLAQTSGTDDLAKRTEAARDVAGRVAKALTELEHPYSMLLRNEFAFLAEGEPSWVAHEYLSPENRPYWRSEFLGLMKEHGFAYVADADFNYANHTPGGLLSHLQAAGIIGADVGDTADLLCYRQIHSPVLTPAPFLRRAVEADDISGLSIASCLQPGQGDEAGRLSMFCHPNGYEVELKDDSVRDALIALAAQWPRALPIRELFAEPNLVVSDLRLLQENGLVELRVPEAESDRPDGAPLNAMEVDWGMYSTTKYHSVHQVVER